MGTMTEQQLDTHILEILKTEVGKSVTDLVKENVAKDGTHMLVVTTETIYTNQNGEVLCMLRASQIRR